MNPYTGELYADRNAADLVEQEREQMVEVPGHLNRAARRVLGGRERAQVSLTSGGKLSRFAASERAKAKTKAKRKMAKASRKGRR